jgi:hypothetical protein
MDRLNDRPDTSGIGHIRPGRIGSMDDRPVPKLVAIPKGGIRILAGEEARLQEQDRTDRMGEVFELLEEVLRELFPAGEEQR